MKKLLANWRLVVLAVLGGANLLVWSIVFHNSRSTLTVYFLDVGQGDAILIEAPNGNQVLVDGGPGRKILSELGQVLPFYDRNLDLIIATHPDADHIAGLPLVLENYQVSGLLEPDIACQTATCRELEDNVAAKSIHKIIAERGEKILLGRGVELEILSPAGPVLGKDTNLASVVAKLSYGGTSFLLTGDAPQAVERQLLFSNSANLDADVLKVGHHGSDTSSSPEFLAAVSPELAVISVGEGNRYGHPRASVLELLSQIGAKTWRTDESGRLKVESDGVKISYN